MYSVNQLTTVSECDALLSVAAKQKDELLFKKTSVERKKASYQEKSVAIDADLVAVTAELGAVNSIISGLPDGDTKEDMVARQKKLEYRKFLLENRSKDFGVIAFLEKEMEVSLIDEQVSEVDVFIAAIETRKSAL